MTTDQQQLEDFVGWYGAPEQEDHMSRDESDEATWERWEAEAAARRLWVELALWALAHGTGVRAGSVLPEDIEWLEQDIARLKQETRRR